MKTIKLLRFALAAMATVLAACAHKSTEDSLPAAPDYAKADCWFDPVTADAGKGCDIFYIVPTCVWDRTDGEGVTQHHMDVYNAADRAAVDPSIRLARGIFGDSCNFYSPYYRQITLESWMLPQDVIEQRYKTASADIRAAFRTFMDKYNEGRPFIIAGHSQGGKAVMDILKNELRADEYPRMVAAYALGFPIKQQNLCEFLVPARDSIDTGVTISYNSVASLAGMAELLRGSLAAINPLNWHTDATVAPKADHLGYVTMDAQGTIVSEVKNMLSTHLDTENEVLIVEGANPDDYYIPSLSAMFPRGNYHVVEMNFFYRNLQQNAIARLRAWRRNNQ